MVVETKHGQTHWRVSRLVVSPPHWSLERESRQLRSFLTHGFPFNGSVSLVNSVSQWVSQSGVPVIIRLCLNLSRPVLFHFVPSTRLLRHMVISLLTVFSVRFSCIRVGIQFIRDSCLASWSISSLANGSKSLSSFMSRFVFYFVLRSASCFRTGLPPWGERFFIPPLSVGSLMSTSGWSRTPCRVVFPRALTDF